MTTAREVASSGVLGSLLLRNPGMPLAGTATRRAIFGVERSRRKLCVLTDTGLPLAGAASDSSSLPALSLRVSITSDESLSY